MTSRPPQQFGFSLIEAMVALLVIAVGLLGIAGMQAWSLSEGHNARIRALASTEASNMAAYMGSNASFWTSQPGGLSVNISAGLPPTISSSSNINLATGTSCLDTLCTSSQIASSNIEEWGGKQQLGLLPQGQGKISCGVQGTCTIAVGWSQQNKASSNTQGIASSITWFRLVIMP